MKYLALALLIATPAFAQDDLDKAFKDIRTIMKDPGFARIQLCITDDSESLDEYCEQDLFAQGGKQQVSPVDVVLKRLNTIHQHIKSNTKSIEYLESRVQRISNRGGSSSNNDWQRRDPSPPAQSPAEQREIEKRRARSVGRK